MPKIDEKFLNNYRNALKKASMTADMHTKYEEVSRAYGEQRKRINTYLAHIDSICSDAQRLIDSDTCELKPQAAFIIGEDAHLGRMVEELRELAMHLHSFAEFGWDDSLISAIDPVIAIAEYSEMEEQIISELGRDRGQILIYESKLLVSEEERRLGIDFFGEAVLRLRDLFRIKRLYSEAREINAGEADNLTEQPMILTNADGESFDCEKVGKMTYRGEIYVEIDIKKELRTCTYNYYLLTDNGGVQLLTLVEDKELEKELDKIRNKLEVGA